MGKYCVRLIANCPLERFKNRELPLPLSTHNGIKLILKSQLILPYGLNFWYSKLIGKTTTNKSLKEHCRLQSNCSHSLCLNSQVSCHKCAKVQSEHKLSVALIHGQFRIPLFWQNWNSSGHSTYRNYLLFCCSRQKSSEQCMFFLPTRPMVVFIW